MILDEPTNDLDIETLELLEELINEYKGTVLLVSHDRQFVDNAVNQCWFFEGDGKIIAYPGGYYDAYQQQQNTRPVEKNIEKVVETAKPAAKPENVRTTTTAKRLSYKQTRELEALPQRIEKLEQELSQLQQQITEPSFFEQPHEITNKVLSDIADKEQALEQAFNLWEELEAIKNCSN